MERTKKEAAVKKLQEELREEKRAELQRRRDITQERKKAAEEKMRLEEDKAKVKSFLLFHRREWRVSDTWGEDGGEKGCTPQTKSWSNEED